METGLFGKRFESSGLNLFIIHSKKEHLSCKRSCDYFLLLEHLLSFCPLNFSQKCTTLLYRPIYQFSTSFMSSVSFLTGTRIADTFCSTTPVAVNVDETNKKKKKQRLKFERLPVVEIWFSVLNRSKLVLIAYCGASLTHLGFWFDCSQVRLAPCRPPRCPMRRPSGTWIWSRAGWRRRSAGWRRRGRLCSTRARPLMTSTNNKCSN